MADIKTITEEIATGSYPEEEKFLKKEGNILRKRKNIHVKENNNLRSLIIS